MRKIFPILVIIVVIFLVLTSGCTNKTPIPNQTPTIQTPSPAVTLTLGSVTESTAAAQPGVTTSSQEIAVQPRGITDPAFLVDVMIPGKIAPGTTLLGDLHDLTRPRIVEVNMLGEIVWKYDVPENLINYVNPGFSVVPLQNGNILAVFPRNGVYEINRTSKDVVWKFIDPKISHDAERLENGNTLVVDGGYGCDTIQDAQVREINQQGLVVWSWYAKDHGFDQAPYNTINNEGWTHTNAASLLQNSDILISLRNFNFTVEVDRDGKVVRTIGEGIMVHQHDPEAEPNGNILFANPGGSPTQALEIDPTGKVVWNFIIPKDIAFSSKQTRDADRLQNGNTLITAANRIIEVTSQGEIVWQFRLKDIQFASNDDAKSRGFYKAIRIPA
jgi:outer membrane protein assembly factor BamB